MSYFYAVSFSKNFVCNVNVGVTIKPKYLLTHSIYSPLYRHLSSVTIPFRKTIILDLSKLIFKF